MIDMDMDVGRAEIWLKEVKETLAEVENTLTKVRTACQTVPGEDDVLFQQIERSGKVMNDIWDTACNAYKSAWDKVTDGIEELGKTGKKIVDLFTDLAIK